MSAKGRGTGRELAVKKYLESRDWWVCRAAGSLGDADLVALRVKRTKGRLPVERVAWLIECKANRDGGPFKNFSPAARQELLDAAKLAGAEAWLAFWPAHKPLRMIHSSDWPGA